MKRLRLQIRRYGLSFALVVAVALIGTVAGTFILLNERLTNPFVTYYQLSARFENATAVAPGLGEPVNVAGVRVGMISGVSLQGGGGLLRMQVDPRLLPRWRLRADARAALVPNTPLQDMEVDIIPGRSGAGPLPPGTSIPASNTTVPIASDELLSALDDDTRQWLTSLIADLGTATRGRGAQLRTLVRALGPTAADGRAVTEQLDGRRQQIAHLVHNLSVLATVVAGQDAQLSRVAAAGNVTLHALASQNAALGASVTALPATIATARRTLADAAGLADQLGPAATALRPIARRLPDVLRQLPTLFRGVAVLPAREAVPFVSATLPLARVVPPLAHDLGAQAAPLTRAFNVLRYVTNEFAYNPGGRNPGFLYWFAWFAHDANSFLSTEDANGAVWRGMGLVSCTALSEATAGQLLQILAGANLSPTC